MRKISYILAILELPLLCSCYQDLKLDNETTPYTVINCIANTDADILADVSKSWFYTESNPSEHISGLPIEVYVNGSFKGVMNDKDGIYESNFHPHSGDTICIRTVIDGKEISANGRMPEKPEITKVDVTHVEVPGIGSGYFDSEHEFVSDTDHQFTYHITFKNPKENRYYFLEIKVIGNMSSCVCPSELHLHPNMLKIHIKCQTRCPVKIDRECNLQIGNSQIRQYIIGSTEARRIFTTRTCCFQCCSIRSLSNSKCGSCYIILFKNL